MRISRDLLIFGLLILVCNGVFGQRIVAAPAAAGAGPIAGAGTAVAAPGLLGAVAAPSLLGLVPVFLTGIVVIVLVSALTRTGDTEDDGIDVDGSDIDSEPDNCPEGYFLRQSTNRCYFLSATKRSFNKAREACTADGGDLANFESGVAELEFIRDAIIDNESDDDWYVLAKKVDSKFVFGTEETDTVISADFFNDDNIPNNLLRNCAAMTFDKQAGVDANDGLLDDTFCFSSNRFVCEAAPQAK